MSTNDPLQTFTPDLQMAAQSPIVVIHKQSIIDHPFHLRSGQSIKLQNHPRHYK
jgi:hypothetical protein